MKTWTILAKAMAFAGVAWITSWPSANAQTVRIHGATTLEKLVASQKAAIEAQASVKLEVVGNGAGRGLVDLMTGEADIAMLGGSLKGIAEAVNKEKPASVDPANLKETLLSNVKLVVVLNAEAGVSSLTASQLGDALTGKATSWKALGGADVPIKVVLPFAGDGARVTFQEQILKGAEYVKNPILRNSAKDIPTVIKQLPGSISILSEQNAAGLKTIALDREVLMPLLLVTKGEPAGDVKKAVDAIKSLIK